MIKFVQKIKPIGIKFLKMSDSPSSRRSYSQVFIEKRAANLPKTKEILSKLGDVAVGSLDSYKEIFNRKNQNFDLQKRYPRLILALKEPPFIYPFSDFIQEYDKKGYYITLAKNCLYDCSYCYLRQNDGGDIVLFVNIEEMLESAKTLPQNSRLSISYDSDILALDSIFDVVNDWVAFAKANPSITVELRTKCTDIEPLLSSRLPQNFQVAFTVLPKEVQKAHERKTPSQDKRLTALEKLLEQDVNIMICIDPLIETDGGFEHYFGLVEELAGRFYGKNLTFSLGVFRMNEGLLKNIRKKEVGSRLFYRPYVKVEDEMSYEREAIESALFTLENRIKSSFTNVEVYKPKFKRGA